MFRFSVSKDMKKRITMMKGRISAHLLTYMPTPIVKKLKISVEQGRVRW